jgi:hypothetical protein
MATVREYEQNSISCGTLVAGSVSCGFGEDDRAIVARGAWVDAGCKDSAPIAVDKLWYRTTDAVQHMALVGWGRNNGGVVCPKGTGAYSWVLSGAQVHWA